MSLECLLLTQDADLLKAIKARFSELGLELLMRKDVASASELSARRHLDGFVIDCDDVPGGIEILNSVRRKRASRRPVVILVVSGRTSISEAFELGANFVISKPLEDGRLRTLLDLALPKMEREHRRYFRYHATLSVELELPTGESHPAKMSNISEGGLAIRIGVPLPEEALYVEFDLPGTRPEKFRARAVAVWTCNSLVGLQFIHIEPRCRESFQAWLNSLEAQSHFQPFAP
jgi:AmiR/NasT family two-component response regulator